MATSKQWQLAAEAAARYQRVLVPSILGPAAQALVAWAGLRPGKHVADIGCGTGAATLYAAHAVGSTGRTIGIDSNPAMLAVAKSVAGGGSFPVEWLEASAEALPLPDRSLDAVVCAQTLQFLQDRRAALGEMRRVLKPGGHACFSLWCSLAGNPYFEALVDAVAARIDPETATGLGAAFQMSDADRLRALFAEARFGKVKTIAAQLELELPEPAVFVPLHVRATPMAAGFDAATRDARDAVVRDVATRLAWCRTETGIRVSFSTHLVRAEG